MLPFHSKYRNVKSNHQLNQRVFMLFFSTSKGLKNFEFRLQFSRSESPPVSRPFHTVEKTFITGNWLLNFQKISKKSWPKIAKNVETHLKTPFSFLNIDSKFKTKIEFRLQFSRSNCPPVCAPFHTVEDWFNLKEAFRRGKINHRMERRRDWGCLNCKRNSIEICFRKTHVLTHICHFWSKINHRNYGGRLI